jgi:predicted nuclease of predicted toxin-antitoxin system
MKILVDMNLSPRWVDFFTTNGIEALHWSSVGPANATDTGIMAYAVSNDYVVFTHDLDFGAILAATHGKKPSVIQIRSADIYPGKTAIPVINILQQLASEITKGALVTISSNKSRIRTLPF